MKRRWLPDNVTEYTDRHGKKRYRFRKAGLPTYHFRSPPGTEAFRQEYRSCLEATAPAPAERIATGTVSELVARFYASPAWRGRMKPSSQRTYRGIIERFRAEHGDKPVALVETHHLDKILGKMAATPAAANNLRKVMKRLFAYAVKCGMRPNRDNPALLTDSFRTNPEGWHTWTEEEIAQYQARHPLGTKARLALEIFLWTSQRRSDASTFGRQHLKNGRVGYTQEKTGKTVWIPAAPQLLEAIAAMSVIGTETFLVTDFGKPFTPAGLGNKVREWCDQAGLPQCSAHGLRKAVSRRLAESKATNLQGRAVTGHKTDRIFAHYAEQADQEALASDAMANLQNRFAKSEEN